MSPTTPELASVYVSEVICYNIIHAPREAPTPRSVQPTNLTCRCHIAGCDAWLGWPLSELDSKEERIGRESTTISAAFASSVEASVHSPAPGNKSAILA